MTYEEAKQYVQAADPDFLPRARYIGGRQSYVCPCCKNGSKRKGTGILQTPKTQYHKKFKCFGCGETMDNVDLARIYYNVSVADAFKVLFDHYGLNVDGQKAGPSYVSPRDLSPEVIPEIPKVDQREYMINAHKNLDPSYLISRGLSVNTQNHYMVGTDLHWKNPAVVARYKAEGKDVNKLSASPRCIIPTSRYSYLARDVRQNLTEYQQDFAKMKYGPVSIFNVHMASKKDVVFVTEGEIDAMTPYEIDNRLEGVGLGSTNNWAYFIKLCSGDGPLAGKAYVLMLDNDKPGKKTQEKISSILKEAGNIVIEPEYEGKDPNCALQTNKDKIGLVVEKAYNEAVQMLREREREMDLPFERDFECEI